MKVCDEFWDYYNTYNAANRFGTIALIKMDEMEHLFDLTRGGFAREKENVATIKQECRLLLSYGGIFQA